LKWDAREKSLQKENPFQKFIWQSDTFSFSLFFKSLDNWGLNVIFKNINFLKSI
jgi:hypothetical protein